LADALFIFRGIAVITGRDCAADRDRVESRIAGVSAFAAVSVSSVGSAAGSGVCASD
jgi:hypothetical protein